MPVTDPFLPTIKTSAMNLTKIVAGLLVVPVLLVAGCKYDLADMAPKPVASFTVTPISGQTNKYQLTSSSQNAFRYDWDKANGVGYKSGNKVDTAYFADAGTYKIKLFVYGQSGMDSAFQTVTVALDDPAALTPFKILTGNSSKKWKLAPEVGALWIGTSDFATTYWQNGLAEVTSRSCLFNDEYTFNKVNKVLNYDSKGDFYVDEEGGNPWPAGMPAVGCYSNAAVPAAFQSWANSNTFSFDVIGNKLQLVGGGAHLGLYKAGNPPDAALPAPAAGVTYDIISLTPTRLVIKLDYGWGAWKFTYVPA
jgi:PKD repeat protein